MTEKPTERTNYWQIQKSTNDMNGEHRWRYGRQEVSIPPVIKSEINGKSPVVESDKLEQPTAGQDNTPEVARWFSRPQTPRPIKPLPPRDPNKDRDRER